MCSGYVVEIGSDVIVFDHGFGAHHRLLELGISPTRVTHFFCSHLHYDHMGDYPRLLLTRWDQGAGKIPDLKVYGPPPIREVTKSLFERGGAFWPDLVARTENLCSVQIYWARGGVGERFHGAGRGGAEYGDACALAAGQFDDAFPDRFILAAQTAADDDQGALGRARRGGRGRGLDLDLGHGGRLGIGLLLDLRRGRRGRRRKLGRRLRLDMACCG